ncbi:hypothetical protein AKO1_014755 [Acrasis kona]|uniref:Uncharacterized protein n=1 Tax=Acrasis kona TaxID=1008807 RepID=A0AAW2Z2B6_9EUKA
MDVSSLNINTPDDSNCDYESTLIAESDGRPQDSIKRTIIAVNLKTKNNTLVNDSHWSNATTMVVIDDIVYVVCGWIYTVTRNGWKRVSKEGTWGSSKGISHDGKIYLVSRASGKLFCWDPATKKHFLVTKDLWKKCGCLFSFKNDLYVVTNNIFKINLEEGGFDQVTHDDMWSGYKDAIVWNNKIYAISSKTKSILCYDPSSKTSQIVESNEDVKTKRPMVVAGGTVLSFGGVIYELDFDNGGHQRYSKDDGYKRIKRAVYVPAEDSIWCL